jgi:hypothetical protein
LVANNWIVTIEQDENGELLLPFPTDLLSQMGWSEGTELFWVHNENGTFSITDKKDESTTGET